ncbi:UNVERIFIED_CONTAM: Sodium/calcium exchanger NCL1 [Sesamum radiatum]|uniref:Sodium/calcium exchanger NCL1 n=1 Tax=Sesamum radiatum TaxID=300843 RepID=A0AAW2T1M4_SESRA
MAIFTLSLCLLMLLFVIDTANGRILPLTISGNLISDGFDAVGIQPPLVNFDGSSPHLSSTCVHTYGFFPCADNIGGYIFQIVVYQYLLIIGGKLITKGSKTIFNIIGTGVYGASIFRILTVLPKMVMVIVSGVLKSKENARVKVSFGVGVYAGSTVFNLTFLWGMCVIFSRKELFAKPATATGPSVSNCLVARDKLAVLKDTGATIDKKTCYTAGIMLLSLIPYIIVQLTDFVNSSFGTRIVILIALVVSTALLLSFFLYQVFDPWIQERSLEYSKYENLLAGFLQHVQRHAKEKLVDENGQPNIPVIKGLFHQTDKDEDKCITFLELENLIHEIQSGKVVQPLSKKKRTKIAEIEHLMARILKHAQNQALEAEHLVTDDGRPNVERIKALFKQFDRDNSKSLSRPELEQLIHSTVRFKESQLSCQEMVKKFIKDFDTDGNDIIDEQEFLHGMTKWLNKAMDVTKCKDAKRSIDEFNKIMWGEVDDLVYEVGQDENKKLKLMTWEFNKSTLEVILGIAILTFLSAPLMTSIQQFSDAIGVPSFFISFVIVPVAMNARSAILAIFPASQKSSRTSSLTFSEIYGGVVMNNMMGLSTLLAIVYIKELEWDHSAEVLTILVVCGIIGVLACTQTTYPLWTCVLAFFLYPLSLAMYYVL